MPTSLLHYNTFGIEVSCDRLVEYCSCEELCSVLKELNESGQRWLHIGGGSNLLFLNQHFDGVILHSKIKGIEICEETDEDVLLRVGAGEDWDQFVDYCVNHGWYGLENLSFIPGEVGSSAVQNVGAYGVEAGDLIETVEGYYTKGVKASTIDKSDCHYAYRESVFKHELRGEFIVTHVWYCLRKSFRPVLTHAAVSRLLESQGIDPEHCTALQVRQAVIDVRKAKLPDPKEIGSAGSFFMNPVVPEEKANALLQDYPNMPHYPAPLPGSDQKGVKIPAGWLIDQCGWKGKQLGRAGVHPLQALVLINCGGATGNDVKHLAETIQADVKTKFGIDIHPEVLFIS